MNRVWYAVGFLVVVAAGCVSWQRPESLPAARIRLPDQHQVRVGSILFLSDLPLRKDQPLLTELGELSEQVCTELRLPPSDQLVYVHLFADREGYEEYLATHHPDLPLRRAYFMARTEPAGGKHLFVLSFWGDHIRTDLRHELTHATLHGILRGVPLWLDEGLAEYFEVPPQWRGVNWRHLREIEATDAAPWKPDLARLEELTQVRDMTRADYREAWAWVHYFLHGSPQARAVLHRYLMALRTREQLQPFSEWLRAEIAEPESELQAHLVKVSLASRSLPVEESGR